MKPDAKGEGRKESLGDDSNERTQAADRSSGERPDDRGDNRRYGRVDLSESLGGAPEGAEEIAERRTARGMMIINMAARFIYEIRWWKWFLTPAWDFKSLYFGPSLPDRESRHMMIDRYERQHADREPQFMGTYPHRKIQPK